MSHPKKAQSITVTAPSNATRLDWLTYPPKPNKAGNLAGVRRKKKQ